MKEHAGMLFGLLAVMWAMEVVDFLLPMVDLDQFGIRPRSERGLLGGRMTELHQCYERPLFIAETGIEDATRPAWLRYMSNEVACAMALGVPMEGLCIYPILNHPGWDDDRYCYNGLFDYADNAGNREAFVPLADELTRQRERLQAILAGGDPGDQMLDTSALDWAAHTMDFQESGGVRCGMR